MPGVLAVAAGVLLLAAAALTVISVLLRWLTTQPVRGDFEMVSLGVGVAVLAFLPWGSLTRAHILVDSFTGWLPRQVLGIIDAFWSIALAVAFLVIAERMAQGAFETWRNGMRTIGLLALPYWWAVAIGALCFALAALAALAWLPRLLRKGG